MRRGAESEREGICAQDHQWLGETRAEEVFSRYAQPPSYPRSLSKKHDDISVSRG